MPTHFIPSLTGAISMQKTVTFLSHKAQRVFDNDGFECDVRFSVVDSAMIGTPREEASVHTIRLTMSDNLMNGWGLADHMNLDVTPNMIKISLQVIEDNVTRLLKSGLPMKKNLEAISLTTQTVPSSCPYEPAKIGYPAKTSFVVDID